MKRCAVLLFVLTLLALSACSATVPAPVSSPTAPAAESDSAAREAVETVYQLPDGLSEEETIAAYFEQLNLSYTSLQFIDLSAILALDEETPQKMLVWMELLAQRRRLIAEQDLCYVETREFPYTISYQLSSEDGREELWEQWGQAHEGEVMYHLRIEGEPGAVYHPMMAPNSTHTIRLREEDGQWKITSHYFPGSVRKYLLTENLRGKPDGEALEELLAEFADTAEALSEEAAASYNGDYAADYAGRYTEAANPDYYLIDDWMGNCANFTSQAILAGFGDGDSPGRMTADWYAGDGGGSPAWENVGQFWDYVADGGSALRGVTFSSVSQARNGDLVQTSSKNNTERGYTHSMIVVDEETLLLGQNSPGCFVYYSDLVNVQTRWYRPISLAE